MVDSATEPWGVKVEMVEMKDVEIPPQMQRAMAQEAQAIREKRARIVKAEGEYDAATKLAEAADLIAANPMALELRRMQMITEVGAEQNTTTILMMPTEFVTVAEAVSKHLLGKNVPQRHRPRSRMIPSTGNAIIDWIIGAARRRTGYFIVFGITIFENLFVVGSATPGETVVMAAAFVAAQGGLSLPAVWIASVARHRPRQQHQLLVRARQGARSAGRRSVIGWRARGSDASSASTADRWPRPRTTSPSTGPRRSSCHGSRGD